MSRFLRNLALIITLVLVAMSFAARALGSIQPINPALRGFTEGCEDKPQPCWYGIVPGVTDRKQADAVLLQYRYPSECVNWVYDNEVVTNIELWPCAMLPPLYFGDVATQFGQIKGIKVIPHTTDLIIYDSNLVVFANRFVSPELNFPFWLKYRFMTVVSISIFAEPIRQIDLNWYGNIPRWKLCQLEPNYFICVLCRAVADTPGSDTFELCK